MEESPIVVLQKRIGVPISSSIPHMNIVDEVDDKELLELSSRLPISDPGASIEVIF